MLRLCLIIAVCGATFAQQQCYDTLTVSKYVGHYAKTVSGKTCQRWDSQSPHPHTNKYVFVDIPIAEIANYCRNPELNGSSDDVLPTDPVSIGQLWCFTTDPKTRWELCGMKRCQNCSSTEKCYDTKTHNFGHYAKTISGKTCQRWDSQTPHQHNKLKESFPDSTLAEAANYCRDPKYNNNEIDDNPHLNLNPIDLREPWCYTTDPNTRWEICAMKQCECISTEQCYKTQTHSTYVGSYAKTESGKTCQRWDSQTPHAHTLNDIAAFPDSTLAEAANYCRDPNNHGNLWCFTTDPDKWWERCDIGRCEFKFQVSRSECSTSANSQGYDGTWKKC